MAITDEMIRAFGNPFHRTLQEFGGFQHQRIFPIDKGFGAEATAHIPRHHTQFFGGDFHHQIGNRISDAMHTLTGDMQRIGLIGCVISPNRAACFHVIGDKTIVFDLKRNTMRRFGKSRIDLGLVAHRRIISDIVGLLVPNGRSTLRYGLTHIDHGFLRGIGHGDRLRRIAGLLDRIRHNESHRITDMAHHAVCQDRGHGDKILRPVIIGQRRQTGHRAKMAEISGGQNQPDPFHGTHSAKITDGKACMGMRTAQNKTMQLPVKIEIGHIVTATGQQSLVLDTPQCLSNTKFFHAHDFNSRFLSFSNLQQA